MLDKKERKKKKNHRDLRCQTSGTDAEGSVSHLKWMLGTKLLSSAGAVSTPNQLAIV